MMIMVSIDRIVVNSLKSLFLCHRNLLFLTLLDDVPTDDDDDHDDRHDGDNCT